MHLLDVEQLRVTLATPHGALEALRGVSLSVDAGGSVGLIGESGSGKSMTALAAMGLLPDGARATGSVRWRGRELLGLPDDAHGALRGREMGMVFQEPMSALNPLHTIGAQVAEPLRIHRRLPRRQARTEALRLLERVRLPQAAARLDAHPHQLSGGQRQRVLIAMALANRPALLIADEPTSALDAALQREVLDLIAGLAADDGMALLLIGHDLRLMAGSVQRLLVMYAGTVVEHGPTAEVLAQPAHPYTQGLLAARPDETPRGVRLQALPGRAPGLAQAATLAGGCLFADRCPRVVGACRAAPPPDIAVGGDHGARCIRIGAP